MKKITLLTALTLFCVVTMQAQNTFPANGNVGIGTTTPSTNLQINGIKATNTINSNAAIFKLMRPQTPGIKWENIAQFDLGSYSGAINATSRLDLSLNDGGGITTSKIMTWQANGNIGIGTTSPTSLLHIASPSLARTLIESTNGAGGQASIDLKAGNFQYWRLIGQGSANGGRFDIHNQTLNRAAFSILPNNNIGIGTTTPTAKLDVTGTFKLNDGSQGVGKVLTSDANGNASWQSIQPNNSNMEWETSQYWGASDVGNVLNMYTKNKGNVGIGTTTPTAKLDINQSSNADWAAQIVNNGGSGKGLKIKASAGDSSTPILQTEDNYGNVKMVVQTNGNVGIGTNNPSHKLEIIGNDNVAAFSSTGSNAYIRLWANAAGGINERVEFTNRGNGKATIWTPGAGDALVVNRNGNIGIGTSNPVAKLTVQGNILASSIKVAVPGSANWSDYVFAKEYQLQSLEEVEAFIQKNQHLPNVPSAAEMVKEGNDLGKTDAKLLEKIEELTLYVIEMKKENVLMKKENLEMKKEMELLKNK